MFLFYLILIIKFLRNIFSPVKAVKAVVVDKYKTQSVSKIQGTFKREGFVVVFSDGNKRYAFKVSEFSFQSYKINEKGTLKYKGNKIIGFS